MEILRDGFIDTRWIGKCEICTAIVKIDSSELDGAEPSAGESIVGNCPYCDQNKTIKYKRFRSVGGRNLLRKVGLEEEI